MQRLVVVLLALAFYLGGAPAAEFRPCTPLPTFAPCPHCTVQDRDRAITACQVGRWGYIRLQPPPGGGEPRVVYDTVGRYGLGRLGNMLGAFYTARAMALLGNYTVEPALLVYDDVRLSLTFNQPPSVGYSRVPELEHYCKVCPFATPFLTTCTGMFLVSDARDHLRRALRRHLAVSPKADVLIQFRCSDSHNQSSMGLLPFDYYHLALAGRVTNRTRVVVLPDDDVGRHSCCTALALTLAAALRHAFNCTVELRQPSTVAADLAFAMAAATFVSGPSTFGLFAAIGTYGQAILPLSDTLMSRRAPCLPNVRWIDTRAQFDGCSRSVLEWLIDPSAFPDTYEHVRRVVRGQWFRKPRKRPRRWFSAASSTPLSPPTVLCIAVFAPLAFLLVLLPFKFGPRFLLPRFLARR